jgi:hypothetical protein
MVLRFPRASRSSRLPSIVPSIAADCFWLVVVSNSSIGGHLRPRRIYFFYFFVTLFAAPKRYAYALSLAFRPERIPSIIPPNAAADFGLIVVYFDKKAAS